MAVRCCGLPLVFFVLATRSAPVSSAGCADSTCKTRVLREQNAAISRFVRPRLRQQFACDSRMSLS